MMCRTSIFALLAAAMTFAAEGVNITVKAYVGAHVQSVTVSSGSQNMTVNTSAGATWKGWALDTAYTVSARVDAGYEVYWAVKKENGSWVLAGTSTDTITLTDTSYSNCELWFYVKYTVTLDSVYGSTGITSVEATYGDPMPSATMPTRTGYTFTGYWYSSGASGWVNYYTAAGASARNWDVASHATLYAGWNANKYTVTLDSVYGSTGITSVEATYGDPMPYASKPTRTGYTFTGYYYNVNPSASTGWETYYDANCASVKTWDKAFAATLYAGWNVNKYTVTLDSVYGSTGITRVEATYGASMPATTMPTRTGYTFTGYWYNSGTQASPKWVSYYTAAGASAREWYIDSPATLYAGWNANQYTVTLDSDGGSGGSASVRATYDAAMPGIMPPTRTGYAFGGYYTAKNGGGTQYYTASGESTANWHETSVTTLYAKWTGETNSVTLHLDGGTFLNGWTASTNYTTGVGLTLPTDADVSWTDHTFIGWYANDFFSGNPVTSIGPSETGNKTFFAKWEGKTYNVAFHANGGKGNYTQHNVPMTDSFRLTPFADLAANNGFTAPQGYAFAEWNTATNGTGVPFQDGEWIYEPLANVANTTVFLYAQWTPNPYEVAFHPNGADGGETMSNQSFTYDVTQNLDHVEFTYTGRAFKEWSTATNHNYQTTYYADEAEVVNLATGGVVNLYANWTNIVYTVAFDPNGGEGTMDSITCTYDVSTNLPACAFTRDGYGFKGWMTNVNDEVLFLDHARVMNLTTKAEAVTLYACWTGETYQVVLDARDMRGDGVLTNGMSVLTNSYVVGDAWNLPIPTNVDAHLSFAGWTYVDTNGVTIIVAESDVVPPPSVFGGTTNLVAAWSWVVDDLAAAVDAPELSFATRGTVGTGTGVSYGGNSYSALWFVQTNFVYNSTNAVQSGALPPQGNYEENANNYSSWLTTKVSTNGVLTFWWKCTAPDLKQDQYGDYVGNTFHFGTLEKNQNDAWLFTSITNLSGVRDWVQVVYTNAGPVTFAWGYQLYNPDRDSNVGGGTGWVDRVTWTPEGGPTVEVTPTHAVPYSWLSENFPDDYASASGDAGALDRLAEKDSLNGKPMKRWEEYWAGTNPNDLNDLFRANIMVSNDVARITWYPDLSVTGDPKRVYHVLCAPTPSAGWAVLQSNVEERLEVELPVTDDSGATTNRFFKVELDWEESQKKN